MNPSERRSELPNLASRTGAILYVLWGGLHVAGGAVMLATVATEGGGAMLRLVATAASAAETAAPGAAASAVFAFHAWNLLWLGTFVVAVAATLGWRNRAAGYWINAAVVAAVDGGLLASTVLPGVMRPQDAAPGLVLFALALAFSTAGLLASPGMRPRTAARASGRTPA